MTVASTVSITTKDIDQTVGSTIQAAFIHTGIITIRIKTSTVVSDTTHFMGESEQNVRTVTPFVAILDPTTLHGLSVPRPIVTMVRAFAIEFLVIDAMPLASCVFPPEFDVFRNLTFVSHSAMRTRKIVILPRQLAIVPAAIAAP